jgi:hypothetical protein
LVYQIMDSGLHQSIYATPLIYIGKRK